MGDGEETYSQQTQFNEKSTQRNVLFTEITNGEQTQQGKILNRFSSVLIMGYRAFPS